MDAFQLLERQHRDVDALFDALDGLNDVERRAGIFNQLADMLDAHADVEEQLFYPEARKCGCEDIVEKSLAAHAEIRRLCQEIRALAGADPAFLPRLSLLHDHVDEHVKQEEFELFPEVGRRLPEQRCNELAQQMDARFKTRMPQAPQFDLQEGEDEGTTVEFEPDVPIQPRA